jgi:hypothetical protein
VASSLRCCVVRSVVPESPDGVVLFSVTPALVAW